MKIAKEKLKQLIRQIISESRGGAEKRFSRGINPEKHMERANKKFLQSSKKFTFYTDVQPYTKGKNPGEHWILREYVPHDHDFPGQDFWLKDCSKNQAIGHKSQFVKRENQKNKFGAQGIASHTPKPEYEMVFEPHVTYDEEGRPRQGRKLVRRQTTKRVSDRSAEMLGGIAQGPNVKFQLDGPHDDENMQRILTNKDELGYDFGSTLDRIRDID